MSHKLKSHFRGAGSLLTGESADCEIEDSRLFQSTYRTVSLEGLYLCLSVHKVFIVIETEGS